MLMGKTISSYHSAVQITNCDAAGPPKNLWLCFYIFCLKDREGPDTLAVIEQLLRVSGLRLYELRAKWDILLSKFLCPGDSMKLIRIQLAS